jgi:hypothetical protein
MEVFTRLAQLDIAGFDAAGAPAAAPAANAGDSDPRPAIAATADMLAVACAKAAATDASAELLAGPHAAGSRTAGVLLAEAAGLSRDGHWTGVVAGGTSAAAPAHALNARPDAFAAERADGGMPTRPVPSLLDPAALSG